MSERSICLTHGKDVDGLASASIIRLATDADVILANYGNLIKKLSEIRNTRTVYICDLGLNDSIAQVFMEQVKRIKCFADIHYIDHHPLKERLRNNLSNLGVDLTHSLDECASVLTYLKLKDRIQKGANLLAAYGAVTDYMDEKPSAKKIISHYDRQFILLESTLLTHALLGAGDDIEFKDRLISSLSEMKLPHEIEHVIDYAQQGLDDTYGLMSEVEKKGVKSTWTAYMESEKGSSGTIANLLVGTFEVPVGIAYRLLEDEDLYEVSLRSSDESTLNLGRIVTQVTEMLGGSGGGHKKASGARIPRKLIKDFLDLMEFQIDRTQTPFRR